MQSAPQLATSSAVKVPLTPSLQYNNLSGNVVDGTMIFAHKEDLVLIRPLGPGKLTQQESNKSTITAVLADFVHQRPLLVFANLFGTFVVDPQRDGAILLKIPHDSNVVSARGLALFDFGTVLSLAIGYSNGEVGVATINPDDFSLQGFQKVQQHSSPITAVVPCKFTASPTLMVSTDNTGDIRFWNTGLQVFAAMSNQGDCATSAAFCDPTLVAVGFGSGTIRIYATGNGAIALAISAHSRWINSLAANANKGVLASVAEDNLLCLWRLPRGDQQEVQLLGHKIHENQLPTGVCAMSETFAVATFEGDCILQYPC